MGTSKRSIERLSNSLLTTQDIVKRASDLNKWIYDPHLREWYSPDEFMAISRDLPQGHEILSRIEFRNPIEGLIAGYQQMRTLQEKIFNFSERVITYYLLKK